MTLVAPFPAFGGKRDVATDVWRAFGRPKQYIEPFCFSAAVLLAAPEPASLEVINDLNGFVANFWRCVRYQPDRVAEWADYPVSHIDLGARHQWLMEQRDRLGVELQDCNWPGDAQVAGWWLWGQCCWIGSGWCDWDKQRGKGHPGAGTDSDATSAGRGIQALGQIPHAGNAGRGIQALGQIPHAGDAGMGIQALGKIPHAGDAGRGIQALGKIPHASNAGRGDPVLLTSSGRVAWTWLHKLATRLERVRVTHGEWSRCLNNHYGAESTAVFLDPPYKQFEQVYGTEKKSAADECAEWAREHSDLRVALCGHIGDYDLPGWTEHRWTRKRHTYAGNSTTDKECIWFSPACLKLSAPKQVELFNEAQKTGKQGELF